MKSSSGNVEKSQSRIVLISAVYAICSGVNGKISTGNTDAVFPAQTMAGSLNITGAAGNDKVIFGYNSMSGPAVNIQNAGTV